MADPPRRVTSPARDDPAPIDSTNLDSTASTVTEKYASFSFSAPSANKTKVAESERTVPIKKEYTSGYQSETDRGRPQRNTSEMPMRQLEPWIEYQYEPCEPDKWGSLLAVTDNLNRASEKMKNDREARERMDEEMRKDRAQRQLDREARQRAQEERRRAREGRARAREERERIIEERERARQEREAEAAAELGPEFDLDTLMQEYEDFERRRAQRATAPVADSLHETSPAFIAEQSHPKGLDDKSRAEGGNNARST